MATAQQVQQAFHDSGFGGMDDDTAWRIADSMAASGYPVSHFAMAVRAGNAKPVTQPQPVQPAVRSFDDDYDTNVTNPNLQFRSGAAPRYVIAGVQTQACTF